MRRKKKPRKNRDSIWELVDGLLDILTFLPSLIWKGIKALISLLDDIIS